MADLEHPIQQRILLACGSGDRRLWRNNVGTGWAGKSTRVTAGNLRAVSVGLRPGDVVIRAARPLHAGLCIGSGDAIGIAPELITPEHVGTRLGLFVSVEVKRPGGTSTQAQRDWVQMIRSLGGRAGFAESEAQAVDIMTGGIGRGLR
jgi:hypothetical protein